jgi:hypothetical protein
MEILQLRWSRRCPLVNTPHVNSQRHLLSLPCTAQLSTNCSLGTPELDCRFSTELFFITTLHGLHINTVSNNTPIVVGVFTDPLLRNGLQNPVILLLRELPSNGRYLQSPRLATGLFATVL